MNRGIKCCIRVLLVGIFLILSAVPGLAAEVRRIPSKASVEQGFLALTLDAEGAEDFRYTGLENKTHMYRGTIKPGGKLQFTIKATLADQKSLPITGRSCIIRMQVVAKKGGEVLKTQNFSKENKSNVFVNYTVPEGADTLEVTEIFVLNNKSKEPKFDQRVTSQNKLILTTSAAGAGIAANKAGNSGDKKDTAGKDANTNSKENAKTEKTGTGKAESAGDAQESKGLSKGMMAGIAVAVVAIAGGVFFYMKKSKEGQAAAEEIARKEKLRQQAIQRQRELQEQNRQRNQKDINPHSQMTEEERMRQQQQREAEQQRLMQQQNANLQQPEAAPQPGATGAYVAGAAGVMGSAQVNAAENAPQPVQDQAPRFCQNCGAPLKPGTRFCENCGAKL